MRDVCRKYLRLLFVLSENCPVNSVTLFLELHLQKRKENILINVTNQDCTTYYRSTSVFNNFIHFFRFISTGISFRSLSFLARISHNTIAEIACEILDAIWDRLVKRHMPFVTENMLQEIAGEFETQWNFRNCVGAIDGKRVPRIRYPQNMCPVSGAHKTCAPYQVPTKLQFSVLQLQIPLLRTPSSNSGCKI